MFVVRAWLFLWKTLVATPTEAREVVNFQPRLHVGILKPQT